MSSSNSKVKESKKYNKLFSYIAKLFFKSWTTYICFLGFAGILVIVSMIPYWIRDDLRKKEILDLIFYMEIAISCIGISAQSIIKICQIFLDPQRDGIEILILSKPIRRIDIWMARTFFWLGFVGFVALINIAIMNFSVIFSPWSSLLTKDDYLLLSVGALLSQVTISLFLMGVTLLVGYLFGNRVARSVSPGILTCSYIVSSFSPFISSVINPVTPLKKINDDFLAYINNKDTNIISQINNKISSMGITIRNPISRIETKFGFNAFIAKNDRLELDTNAFRFLDGDGFDYYPEIQFNANFENEIINSLFMWLYESQKGKQINFDPFLVSLDYLNPISGVLKIARTNSQYNTRIQTMLSGIIEGNQTLSRYSSYSNIAPDFGNNKHYNKSEQNTQDPTPPTTPSTPSITYYTTYQRRDFDIPWVIAINWITISAFLFAASSYIYMRKDFR